MNEIISYGRFRCKELFPHKNRGMEITYIEKGMLEWAVEGVPEKVGPGSVFFTLPWQVHGSLHPTEPDNLVWHVLFHLEKDHPSQHKQFQFPRCFGFTPAEMRTLSTAFTSGTRHCFRATSTMRRLIPELVHELQSSHALRKAHSISLLRTVLIELKRTITGETVDNEIHGWSENKVQELIAELSSNSNQPWTLKQMVARCGIGRTRLNTVFQKLTGGTPVEYLTRLRIEQAKMLLRETNIKVTGIAFECGFGTSQYFANIFKRVTGMTPTEYRAHGEKLTSKELRKWVDVGFRSKQEEHRRVQYFSNN